MRIENISAVEGRNTEIAELPKKEEYLFSTVYGEGTESWSIDWGTEDISGYTFSLIFSKGLAVKKVLTLGDGLVLIGNSIIMVESYVEDLPVDNYSFRFKRFLNGDQDVFLTGTKTVKSGT